MYQAIFENAGTAMMVIEEDMSISSINTEFSRLSGFKREEIANRNFQTEFFAKDISDMMEEYNRSRKTDLNAPPRIYENQFINKDGKIKDVIIKMNTIPRTRKIVAIFEDITENKRAVEALRASEEKYKGVVDNIAIGVSLISPDMEILALNNQTKQWYPDLDISTRPICYKTFNDPPREGICSYCPTYLTLQDGGIHESVTETPTRGMIKNYRIISSPIRDKEGRIIAAIEMVEDVSENLKLRESLSISEKLYRTIFETTGAATVIIDEDMTILMANREFEKLVGYTKQEVENKKKWFEFVKNYDLKEMKNCYRQRKFDPNIPPKNYEFTFADGCGNVKETLSVVSMIPETKKSVASFLDITDMKRLAMEIQKSENKYRLLAANISDVIWTMDLNFNSTYVSPSVKKLRGYTADEATRQKLEDILTPASYEIARDVIRRETTREKAGKVQTEKPITLELEMICKNGSLIWAEIKVTFLRDSHGRLIEILGVTRDITQRKHAEEALKQSKQKLKTKSRRLEEANTALKVLLKHRETDKINLQDNVLSNVRELVMPCIEKLKTYHNKADHENYLNILETNLSDIVSPFLRNITLNQYNLTPKEIQIANLIKCGKTTKEIAGFLYLAPKTVNFHRENIRKKLGLTNKKVNLQSHLLSLS